jgi:hypothetical protein
MSDEALHLTDTAPLAALKNPLAGTQGRKQERTNTAANVRTATVAMLTAFALFGVFGTQGIAHFARDLPGNAATDVLVRVADRWHALMLDLGPGRVEPALRNAVEWARALHW